MRPRSAEVQTVDRRLVLVPVGYRPHIEQLVEGKLYVVKAPVCETEAFFQIGRCFNLAVQDGGGKTGSVVL